MSAVRADPGRPGLGRRACAPPTVHTVRGREGQHTALPPPPKGSKNFWSDLIRHLVRCCVLAPLPSTIAAAIVGTAVSSLPVGRRRRRRPPPSPLSTYDLDKFKCGRVVSRSYFPRPRPRRVTPQRIARTTPDPTRREQRAKWRGSQPGRGAGVLGCA